MSYFKLPFLACLFLSVAVFSGTVMADEITYETTVIASGTLGGASYTDQLVTITGVGDTEDVETNGPVHTLFSGLVTTVEIDGLGTAEFTDAIQAVSNNNSELGGFGNTSNSTGLFFVDNEIFETYDLRSEVGPVSGTAIPVFGVPHQTTAGAFRINTVSGSATFAASVKTVPEPSSAIFLGALGVFAIGRKRQKRS